MALTARWLTVGEAAQRLRRPEQEVLRLAISETIHSRLAGDHWELCTAAVEEYADETASELAASRGEDLAETAGRPSVGAGPELPDFIEDEYERNKGAE